MDAVAQKGYLIQSLGIATKEVISRSAHDHVLTIVKNALKSYIDQFFNSQQGREILGIISPDAIRYVVNKSIKESEDHTKVSLQLASFFEDLTEHLPCILIADSSCKFVNPGLNSNFGTEAIEGKLHTTYRIIREVGITLGVGAGDETTANQLMALLQFIFGDLRHILNGEQLLSSNPQDEWCITMPRNLDSDKVVAVDIPPNNDPKDKIWRGVISFPNPFYYEDTIRVVQDMPKVEIHNPNEEAQPMSIEFPDTLRINSPYRAVVHNWNPLEHMICLDDYRVASIQPESYIITARSFGDFWIRVLSKKETNENKTPKVLCEKKVTVVS